MHRRAKVGLASLLLLIAGGSLKAQTQDLPALDCIINPHKVFDLGSGVRGVINRVYVERSDFVEANQVVAELDAGVERASVAVAKARADITSEVRLGELNLAFDQRRKERMDDLYEAKSVSIQNQEDAELEAEISRQRLYEATERESIRKLELWRARELLDQKIIRSPISGFVLKKFKSEGEYIEDQPIVRIAQLDQLSVEVIAPMDLFGKIKVGMSADIYPETLKPEPHRARVSVVDRMGDIASGTFGVRLNLPNADYAIPAGVKCTLQFALDDEAEQQAVAAERIAGQPGEDIDQRSAATALQPRWASVQPQSQPRSALPPLDELIQYPTPSEPAIAQ